jgi:hypothetical protein
LLNIAKVIKDIHFCLPNVKIHLKPEVFEYKKVIPYNNLSNKLKTIKYYSKISTSTQKPSLNLYNITNHCNNPTTNKHKNGQQQIANVDLFPQINTKNSRETNVSVCHFFSSWLIHSFLRIPFSFIDDLSQLVDSPFGFLSGKKKCR